jgi:hypothetical protein
MAATSAATARNTPFEGGGGGGMDSGTRGEEYVAFMVRMANLDVTMCSPVPGLDLEWNSFEGTMRLYCALVAPSARGVPFFALVLLLRICG